MAHTRKDVKALNQLAQMKRQDAGELGEKFTMIGEEKCFEGDRFMVEVIAIKSFRQLLSRQKISILEWSMLTF